MPAAPCIQPACQVVFVGSACSSGLGNASASEGPMGTARRTMASPMARAAALPREMGRRRLDRDPAQVGVQRVQRVQRVRRVRCSQGSA